ncbi:ATP-binding protein [Salinispirillum sp. LH 10-3-1]|uniref:histidine kinase n=1 Tax=Salinispirillum sp. LH 10-3-1 TaxID=2952525 RepID=A0AB38YFF8_9GAMM
MMRILAWGLVCVLLSSSGALAAPVLLPSTMDQMQSVRINVVPHIERAVTPAQVSVFELLRDETQEWTSLAEQTLSLTHSPQTNWLRLNIDPTPSAERQWHLVFSNAMIDFMDVYEVTSDGPRIIYRSGLRRDFQRRSIDHRYFIVPLTLTTPTELVMRIDASYTLEGSVVLWSGQTFWPALQREDLVNWLYYGAILALISYNLLLFLIIRERPYLLYVAYIAAFSLFMNILDGFFYQHVWPAGAHWHTGLIYLSIGVAVFFAAQFATSFLQLKRWHLPTFLLCQGIALAALLLALNALWLPPRWLAVGLFVLAVGTWSAALLGGLVARQHGQSPAHIFLLAWLAFGLASAPAALAKLGVIDSHIMYNWAMKGGAIVQAFLLSFALGNRIRLLRQKTQEAELAAKARADFLAQMSHEIRTPMSGVMGMLELLQDTPLSPDQKRYLNAVQASGDALMGLLNDILDRAKIDAGKLELNNDTFTLHTLTDRLTLMFQPQAKQRGLTWDMELDPALEGYWQGDVKRLQQVLINLVGNAFKFTEEGGIRVQVNLQKKADEVRWLSFHILDTGPGLAPEVQEQVFESYVQADQPATQRGTGLGLYICRQLVKLMNGRIGVRNRPNGAGSDFWFEIPLQRGAEPLEPLDGDTPPLPVRPLCVLVAEDNPVNQAVISGMLRSVGHDYELVGNGREAVARIQARQGNFDVVLMDLEMPVLDGLAATREIRHWEHDQSRPRIPILALTAHALDEYRALGLKAGVDEFLTKPIRKHILMAALDRLLDER